MHLIFLLVTPAEQPNLQVLLLGQVARVAGNASSRERLLKGASKSEVIEIITEAERPLPDGSGSAMSDSDVSH